MDDCLLELPCRKLLMVGLSGVDGPARGEYGDVVDPSSGVRSGEAARAGEAGAGPTMEPVASCRGRGPTLFVRLDCFSFLVVAAADASARLAK